MTVGTRSSRPIGIYEVREQFDVARIPVVVVGELPYDHFATRT
jgi:hypothetical protein